MSADNYIFVDKMDNAYRVWDCSASMDDDDPTAYGKPVKVVENTDQASVFDAVNFAYDLYSEYGTSLSPEVRADMEMANNSMNAQRLMGVAWSKSDRAENSKDRDGWGFVASHATEILAMAKATLTKGE